MANAKRNSRRLFFLQYICAGCYLLLVSIVPRISCMISILMHLSILLYCCMQFGTAAAPPTNMPTTRFPTRYKTRIPTSTSKYRHYATWVLFNPIYNAGRPSSPSLSPSALPSIPTTEPSTRHPSSEPTQKPTQVPSFLPSHKPTNTNTPSGVPSVRPSSTNRPSNVPTVRPSRTKKPSLVPTAIPSIIPTAPPTTVPSSSLPSQLPSVIPTKRPTSRPSKRPSKLPTGQPSSQPSQQPSGQPSSHPAPKLSLLPMASKVPLILFSVISQSQNPFPARSTAPTWFNMPFASSTAHIHSHFIVSSIDRIEIFDSGLSATSNASPGMGSLVTVMIVVLGGFLMMAMTAFWYYSRAESHSSAEGMMRSVDDALEANFADGP